MALTLSDKDSIALIHARLSQLKPSLKAYVIARVARKWETILPTQTQPINADLLLVDDMVC
ncbi:7-cyano-7-deazaguanine tRNA-ribosyltransferase [Corchorus olitorius]|uniref:7-cyano-7-deazaguanine tRNA-ribosyltransferase n=1 Tax=Corchorus olitorius TaxID=93759 RepID=A0A1R3K1Q3_9ROSI|nr:7-cyano-7-deazaguanine tRNA-ribosyltransferase [Corchorus olitorius]